MSTITISTQVIDFFYRRVTDNIENLQDPAMNEKVEVITKIVSETIRILCLLSIFEEQKFDHAIEVLRLHLDPEIYLADKRFIQQAINCWAGSLEKREKGAILSSLNTR